MSRKEVNGFSVSFLDLLSGALASVIILFIVVPKLDKESRETLTTMEELDLQADELEEMVEQLAHSVDSTVYEQVIAQVEELQVAMSEARRDVNALNNQLSQKQDQVSRLNQRVSGLSEEVARKKREARLAKRDAENAQQEAAQAKAKSKMFGINAEFAIVFQWDEDADLDLYLTDQQTGRVCYYRNTVTPFGSLLKDYRTATGKESYEIIYQPKLVPGNYKLYVSLYRLSKRHSTVTAKGYMAMYPFSENERKIAFQPVVLTRSERGRRKGYQKAVGEFSLPFRQ